MARIMMFHDEVPITRITDLDFSTISEPIYVSNPELINEINDIEYTMPIINSQLIELEQLFDDIITERAVLHCPIIISDRPPYFGG